MPACRRLVATLILPCAPRLLPCCVHLVRAGTRSGSGLLSSRLPCCNANGVIAQAPWTRCTAMSHCRHSGRRWLPTLPLPVGQAAAWPWWGDAVSGVSPRRRTPKRWRFCVAGSQNPRCGSPALIPSLIGLATGCRRCQPSAVAPVALAAWVLMKHAPLPAPGIASPSNLAREFTPPASGPRDGFCAHFLPFDPFDHLPAIALPTVLTHVCCRPSLPMRAPARRGTGWRWPAGPRWASGGGRDSGRSGWRSSLRRW